MRGIAATVIAVLVVALAPGAKATNASCPAPDSAWSGNNPWCYAWQGDWQQTSVTIPSPDGPLAGTEFAPVKGPDDPLPAVAVLHGLSGKQTNMWWLGRFLAGHGYVALTVTTAGNNQDQFLNAMEAMVDYLASGSDPYAAYVDTSRIGASGHSAGARATNWIQDVDPRVRAIVSLDNLGNNLAGDSGTYLLAPQCTTGTKFTKDVPVTPRVPALGLASDTRAVTSPECGDPDIKKAAWSDWRATGLPTTEIVLRDSNHFSFDQDISRTVTAEAYLEVIAYYTRAWFDTYLKGKRKALSDVMAANVLGTSRDMHLSTQFRSAAFLPEIGVDCASFTLAACPPRR